MAKVILLDNVRGLGKVGDEANVADGYARNYLVPRGLGVFVDERKAADNGVLRQLEKKRVEAEAQYNAEKQEAEKLAEQINEQTLTIPVQVNEDESLYGSVSQQTVVNALQELGISIDRSYVGLGEPIKELGMFTVDIHLHDEVTASVKVWVVKMES